MDSAISLFGDKNAGGIVLLQSFKDYYYGYESVDGKPMLGYVDMMEDLNNKFPLSEPQICLLYTSKNCHIGQTVRKRQGQKSKNGDQVIIF